jgi:ribosomal-protein-alanine N-acetyltransferase
MHLVSIPQNGKVSIHGIPLNEIAASAVSSTVQLYARRGYVEPWVGYLAVEEDTCVGCCGFTSPPAESTVEIAYFTYPDFERRGIATRMAERLISIALECDPSMNIVAHTLAEKNASNHILQKLGFAFGGALDHPEDGMIWVWRYKPKSKQP